jgi:DNA-binding transcriptional LysR family regulator
VELRYLLYFATVAEQQSFTRAAEKLGIAQSAISQQIKTLEEELEVQLLLRTKRSVKLTAAGQAFLREAKDILNRVEQSRVEARRAAQGETGALSIGFFKTGSFLFLPELIHAYRTRYASVRIDLHEQTPSEQLDSLELGRIDVGFTRPVAEAYDGYVDIPQGPGLGIELNEKVVCEASREGHSWKNPVWRNKDGSVAEW